MNVEYSFLTNNLGVRRAAMACLANDTRAARLSRTFRAYYLLRPLIPIRLRQALQKKRKQVAAKQWYTPDLFVADIAEGLRNGGNDVRIVHPWPVNADFAFILTHDVETQDGLKNIERISHIEEQLGFRSSWNFVPYKYSVDEGLIEDLRTRGFEIGIHGYNHDGKLYWSRRTFQRRAAAINAALREFGAVGFRSPMVHRNLAWLQQLEVEYDSSCFDIDPYQAMPGGVGSLWPFIAGRFVELPYTLPQDHTVFVVRGERDCETWRRKLEFIAQRRGMALMLTHPDYLTASCLDLYREFLETVRDRGEHWHALPSEVARWWRERESYQLQLDGSDHITPVQLSGRATQATISLVDNDFSIHRVR